MGYHQDTRKHRIIRGLVRFPSASGYRFSWISSCRMEILFIIEQACPTSLIIFTTAYDEYAVRAFTVNSIDYLLKPIRQERLEEAIQKFEHVTSKYNQKLLEQNDLLEVLHSLTYPGKKYRTRFLISGNEKLITLQVEDIAYFYSLNKITFAVTRQNKEYIIDFPLDKLMEQLDPDKFFPDEPADDHKYRIHRENRALFFRIRSLST